VIGLGLQDGLLVHVMCSVISGIFLVLALNPFDVITTRLYNQKYENGKGSLLLCKCIDD
jgi:solute carrier family 25 protein 34/35